MRHNWNQRALAVLESTYAYDAAMTELLLPEIAKRYTTADEQNENYRARLMQFKSDLKGETV
ncbi:hypothetical protein H7K32_11620 [Brevibacillus agri]|uniref:hypothetical protein n=1 Tax=Brevibacillus agri TaxID=51101 RepID=UPI001C8F125B|nr:hypothetical protein [Brevibacillus agri]MBY0052321.1 hypothetical protein [Brevibacillus agri]